MERVKVFYNEIDPYCCAWLSNLMDAGHIRPGTICDKLIADVTSEEVKEYDLVHWFAGIAGWDAALTLAGWQFDGRVIWTGSCPCQPFSTAGKRSGAQDERHLWPHWFRLIKECGPGVIFGEQVAAAIGWGWLDAVLGDLEEKGYATGAAVLGAHSVGAPHIRQRLWFVAVEHAKGERWRRRQDDQDERRRERSLADRGAAGLLADAVCERRQQVARGASGHEAAHGRARWDWSAADGDHIAASDGEDAGDLGHAEEQGLQGATGEQGAAAGRPCGGQPRLSDNPWSDCVWLPCTDGRARPTQPGLFPLAHGVPGRVGRLRSYGNAIVPQVAAEFVRACMP